jgi:hypothetical protein
MNTLDAQLLAAHATNDTAQLVNLYTQAADAAGNIDTACFYLTHAYVFALEIGHSNTETLRARLVKHGREPAT